MKRVIIASMMAFAALSSFAGVMTWQVGSDAAGPAGKYDAARLVAKDTATGTEVVIQDSTGLYYQDASEGFVSETQTVDLSPYSSGYNFFIELGAYSGTWTSNSADTWLAQSSAALGDYQALIQAGAISSAMSSGGGGLATSTYTPAASAFTSVPEPSSAMLMLVGLAVAGLKRRRA